MYPAEYFLLFPSFPKENTVFVAMSFADRLKSRYENVIAPVIRNGEFGDTRLEPDRVDADTISESILVRILKGVAHSQFVIADITTTGWIDGRPVRNGNVLYEVGLAHAQRLYEEVLLFRSDDDCLPFDCAHIRVNSYDPDNKPEEAQDKIRQAIIRMFKSVDNKRRAYIQRLAGSLDAFSWWTLVWTRGEKWLPHPNQKSIAGRLADAERLRAISRLLEMGALRMRYQKITPEVLETTPDSEEWDSMMRYECTEIGSALLDYASHEMGLFDSKMMEFMEKRFQENQEQSPVGD